MIFVITFKIVFQLVSVDKMCNMDLVVNQLHSACLIFVLNKCLYFVFVFNFVKSLSE